MKDNYYQHLQLPSRDEYPCHAKQWPTPPSSIAKQAQITTKLINSSTLYELVLQTLKLKPCPLKTSGFPLVSHSRLVLSQSWLMFLVNKNRIMVSGKLAKIMRIFVDTGHIKNRGVIYWPKRIGPVIPTLWSSHNFSHDIRYFQAS